VFSTEPYTHAKPLKAFASFGAFVVTVFGLCGVVYMYYPDKASVPRTFADGLEVELGGPNAVAVSYLGGERVGMC
jgi:NADH dehydrogenase (ubiquinone) 1 beta subcomplex subunit 8